MALPEFWQSELRATEVVQQHKVTVLPVDPFDIANTESISCHEFQAIAPGISGCLMKVGDRFGFFYSDRFSNDGFRRFTFAHELGHYFLPGHMEYLFSHGNERHESDSGFISDDGYEREADTFAAALLMPEELFKEVAARAEPGLKAVEILSEQCVTSLTATAIRYAKLSDQAIAVVCSKDNRVQFAFMSEILKARRGLTWIKKNSCIPEETATFRFNKEPRNVTQGKRVSSNSAMDAWFQCGSSLEVVEEVVGLGTYGKTLTVLWGESVLDQDEEEENQESELENMLPSDRWRQPRED